MDWKEPVKTAEGRERFWNQPRITIPVMLGGTVFGALICSLLGAVGTRLYTGSWHLPISALLAAVIGGLAGLAQSFRQRKRIRPQEVELRSDEIIIRDTQQRYIMRHDQLRGYSLVETTVGGVSHRLLMLYPLTGRAFSIGIPDIVTDEQVRGHFGDRVPFVTIIDNEVLSCPITA